MIIAILKIIILFLNCKDLTTLWWYDILQSYNKHERGNEMSTIRYDSPALEGLRRGIVEELNSQVQSDDPVTERHRLEEVEGQVWDTQELSTDFEVLSFLAPFVIVRRKKDGVKGTLCFQHHPRFYFDFVEDSWKPY